jgi:hypothetical protein
MKSSPVMLTAALVLCLSGNALVQVAAASQTCARPTTSRRPRPPRRTCARPTASRRPRTPWRLPRRPRTSRCPRRRSQHVPDRPDLVRTCGRTRGCSLRGEAPVARPCRAPHGVSLGSRRRPPRRRPAPRPAIRCRSCERIDHQTALTDRVTGHAVTASSDRQRQALPDCDRPTPQRHPLPLLPRDCESKAFRVLSSRRLTLPRSCLCAASRPVRREFVRNVRGADTGA